MQYKEDFPVGSIVRIINKKNLQKFYNAWNLHNKLSIEQFNYADQIAKVKKVGFYHGGDVLYELEGISGIWHEQCLEIVMAMDKR